MPSKQKVITVVMIGDVVGRPGRELFAKWSPKLREQYGADIMVVNGENSANNGRGINAGIVKNMLKAGADVITTGNHVWAQKGTQAAFAATDRLVRPINFPAECPGQGYVLVPYQDTFVAIVNAQGRVFMPHDLSCPMKNMDSVLTYLASQTKLVFVDFHAETTSESQGFGYYLDGRVSAVVGTHTHVQTADERVLPKGTAYITDLGCCGARDSMLGMKKEPIIQRMITQMPVRFLVEHEGPFMLHGVCIKVDVATGKALSIERIRLTDEELQVVAAHEE